jgi:DNA-binding MarR family transcriptional regulator
LAELASDPPGRADEIHRLLVALTVKVKAHEEGCLPRLGLNRMEAKTLYRLEPGEAVPVRTIAERGGVDASNLSSAVKSLAERGLVERGTAEHDRRVRAIRLSPAGRQLRRRLVGCLFDGYPAVAGLSDAQQELLRDLLRRL